MDKTQINPNRINKPIQLLAAWLAGLSIIDSSFLTAANFIHEPKWASALLVIASVINVPLFLISLFLLQTKFRPEMQEDTFYSKWLESKYGAISLRAPRIDIEKQVNEIAEKIISKVGEKPHDSKEIVKILKESEINKLVRRFKESRSLSEIYLYRDKWEEIVNEWSNDDGFIDDMNQLTSAGIVILEGSNFKDVRLTPIGQEVAKFLKEKKDLWNQRHERHMPRKEN